MLSANAHAVPEFQASAPLSRQPFRQRLQARFVRLFRRLLKGGKTVAPGLPENLRADAGFEQPAPERAEAFWQDRQRSVGRDLPL
ncbi:hypothetical protein [Aliirhizobium smilacinae]|uniref:Uncharacterized protein n=1 Tax=Aliirhizobium smilacinae TaxID=1395944 RepID=A0A5C4XHM7_9HYPH|nr:hypothetical protein [Rhizobium smilacinae]TNM62872.1 hypothetical protein FHP24_16785 [Rhizobium smilacinae]